jgi:hypothetical protein
MIRSSDPNGSTIISYHPSAQWNRTTAERLKHLVHKVGESVYWQKIFEQSKDPTFLFLAILWYALYAWDESLDHLYIHMNWLVRSFFIITCIVRAFKISLGNERPIDKRQQPNDRTAHYPSPTPPLRLPARRIPQICDIYQEYA